MTSAFVPRLVTEHFGTVGGPANALEGGMSPSILVGSTVFKQVDDSDLAAWSQELLAATTDDYLMVPTPVRAADGRWVVDGWTATVYLPDLATLVNEPVEVARVGRQFAFAVNRALETLSADGFDAEPVTRREDRWARAYRAVWDPTTTVSAAGSAEIFETLRSVWMSGPTAPPEDNVFHCDLTGNVMADPDGTPVVLDFTPAFGPIDFGSAVVVGDHLLWRDGRADLIETVGADPALVARAIAFRLLSEQFALDAGELPGHGGDLEHHHRVLRLLDWS